MARTELQKAVYAAFDEYPNAEDLFIAKHVYEATNPDEYKGAKGQSPSKAYVARLRKRHAIDTAPAVIEVELPPDFFDPPEIDDPIDDDPDPIDPFKDFITDDPEPDGLPDPIYPIDYELSNEQIGKIISLPFNKLAKYTGYQGWAIDPADQDDKEFLELAAIVSKKHAPAILMEYGLEVMFAVSLAGFMGDRLYGYKQHQADQTKNTTPALIQQDNLNGSQQNEPILEPTEPDPEPLHVDQTQGAHGVSDFAKRQRKQ